MDPDGHYFVFENRLASFSGPQQVSKGRASTAGPRAPKALHWPHKTLSPVALAKAGFYFEPHPKSPDNVVCFLCSKSLDGWEEHDDAVEEHLRHSPTCGWAIMAAIETGFGNYGKVHPLDPAMIEARKATFAGRWPYEPKKGFKGKTKKLVEGGWKYTPSLDADDMTTCAYCNLALEGWESGDNPFDEHYRREPGCAFFALINQYPAPKKGRAKAARTSKASRLSVQSVATVATAASDLASAADITADHDDSVMTTVSTMTQGGKKPARGRKATTGKGRKTKAKKEEAIEILEDEPQLQEPSKETATRGRKRPSDAVEDAEATNAEAPAPKKRAARVRPSTAIDTSSMPDTDMVDVPAKPAAGKKGRASNTKRSRKVSGASVRSQASTASLRAAVPDDDEIDRQLEADLERYHSDADEMAVEEAPAPVKGRPKKAVAARKASGQKQKTHSEAYAMFDPAPMVPDEAEIEADLEALRAEMDVERPAVTETLVVPKKGRKAGTRKASRQTKKAPEPAPQAGLVEDDAPVLKSVQNPVRDVEQPEKEAASDAERNPADDPDASTGTVVTKPVKRGRGRPSKKSTASQASIEQEYRQSIGSYAQKEQLVDSPARESLTGKSAPEKIPRKPVATASQVLAQKTQTQLPPAPSPAAATPTRAEKTVPIPPPSASRLPQPPSTPRTRPAPSTHRANQPAVSPAHSPQSSDAENQPRTLQPAANLIAKRVVLGAVSQQQTQTQTPQRNPHSPSKRNNNNSGIIAAGLHSHTPWQPADLDLLFSSSPAKSSSHHHGDTATTGTGDRGGDNKEKAAAAAAVRLLRKGTELTSPERRMTVEEWIYYNAGLAEQRLKAECEAMVAGFEREGGRAFGVLEGLVVD
ncbi:hypothetical protein N658DRAFT_477355 [Parathielavia hyrcaniae]|uniref:Uncharacterized protein n=1 Tax=Parathielavia hyrcaniae TaxID=113614 RepID=A0AAN6SZB4_9PEZI|nr:hypothetical protein N658DRAFT_477355 [Parathielavia hyrcaniae]